MIRFFSEDIPFKLRNKRQISSWLKQVAGLHGYNIGDINYIFCSDPYILEINKRFLGHDYFTDIITFDNSEDFLLEKGRVGVSADIYISIDTVKANGSEYGDGFDKELLRVIVHGLLHLIGFDDVTPELQSTMRDAENSSIALYDSIL